MKGIDMKKIILLALALAIITPVHAENQTNQIVLNETTLIETIEGLGSEYIGIYTVFSVISFITSNILIFFIFRHPIMMLIYRKRLKWMLKKYKSMTGRSVIIMSHAQTGLFGSMITMTDAHKIEEAIKKIGNKKKIDLIINTFGGELFASIRIARMLKDNPNIRVVVPKYAWSGGTMITMGASKILCNRNSIFGAVDPQYGTLWKSFSAKEWKEIVNKKKKEADDESIALASMGDKLMKEVKGYIDEITENKDIDRKLMYDILLEGKYSHSHMVDPETLKDMGFDVEYLDTEIPDRAIEMLKDWSGVMVSKGK